MDANSDESEISESDISDYSEKPYKLLRSGHHKVKVKGVLRCPFCRNKKKQNYKYNDLLAHASGVSKGPARSSAKEKANHLALAKYLEKDLASDTVVPSLPIPLSSAKRPQAAVSDIYVWPWMVIVINPMRSTDDNKSLLLDPAYWLKELSRFNPLHVKTLWIEKDSVVVAVPEFNSTWNGFKSATELVMEYELKNCSKKDWNDKIGDWKSKSYAWFANADDYNSQGLIAEYLSTAGKLRSFSKYSLTHDSLGASDDDLVFVYPWVGILANVKRIFNETDRKYVGESNGDIKMRDALMRSGIDIKKVKSLWYPGESHAGFALVHFNSDCEGFKNTAIFERHFERNHCGREEYYSRGEKGENLFGWVATEEDYNSDTIFGHKLRKSGDLKSVFDRVAEKGSEISEERGAKKAKMDTEGSNSNNYPAFG